MNSVKLPAPGLLLGSYPERHEPDAGLSVPAMLLARLSHSPVRTLARYHRFVAQVRALEPALARESAQSLSERLANLRARLARDGLIESLLAEAFAVIALMCSRELGKPPYDTQLIAARIMLDNRLAEMATGEGKTLAAGVAAASAALAGIPVHVITANDYLVQRDALLLAPLYRTLGLSVGTITLEMSSAARQAAYACDIAYCTARELVFDYLRDLTAQPERAELARRAARLAAPSAAAPLLRGLCLAIIDEADSILIDEARVPLVLSRAVPDGCNQAEYRQAWAQSAQLDPGVHCSLDTEARSARLTDAGLARLRTALNNGSVDWPSMRHCENAVSLALVARHLLRRNRDYLVQDGKVLIVDENTGRTASGRAWSQGLHQAVEIKEGCVPSAPVVPLTQITYQRFFPRYFRLGGMSGTLTEARNELLAVYGLDVVSVPLRQPSRRSVLPARIFSSQEARWQATVARVRALHAQGRPVLIGTDSVADSQALSQQLTHAGLAHALLNASQDQHEAQIVAAAGHAGAITVATNMAGRGTDIILDSGVAEQGGLHVICCQQNMARRIDRQLVGRCARQGDPGSAETFIALDGPLLAGHWLARVLRRFAEDKATWAQRLGALTLQLAQRAAERQQRAERAVLLRTDKEMSRWFAFSGRES